MEVPLLCSSLLVPDPSGGGARWTRDTNVRVGSELPLPSCALAALGSKICVQFTPCYSQPHLSSSPGFFLPLACSAAWGWAAQVCWELSGGF